MDAKPLTREPSDNALTTAQPREVVASGPSEEQLAKALELFRRGKADTTLAAYDRDLAAFGRWMAETGRTATEAAREALRVLIASGRVEARLTAATWVDAMGETLAPATVSRKLAALRSAVELFHGSGLVGWTLDVKGPPVRALRNTRGMGEEPLRRVLAHLRDEAQGGGPKAVRDHAVGLLLAHLALRRVEVARLNVGDVDLEGARVWILGKGRAEREAMTITPALVAALGAWCELRAGDADAPLFVGVDRHGNLKANRITTRAVELILKGAAEAAGEDASRFSPHKVRHTAITAAARLAQGDLTKVAALSRHRNLKTVSIYLDNLADAQGDVSNGLAEALA